MNSKSLIKTIKTPKIYDDCTLCFAQNPGQIPFSIKRIYYILKPKKGSTRGAHTHYQTQQVLFCLQGQVRLLLDDGTHQESIILTEPETGVFLPPMVWHEMKDLDQNSIILVLASERYNPKDYIRNYDQFQKLAKEHRPKNPHQ